MGDRTDAIERCSVRVGQARHPGQGDMDRETACADLFQVMDDMWGNHATRIVM
ncbi:hypothetical protein [Lichenicola cladoniae]|uniref:hypothetical protein n=1 Tax=Lichenicola cladoniae TaxID=1484109 RepID=UPI001EF6EA55|nr:hypothetical protein [Lichenicola cladoniae]